MSRTASGGDENAWITSPRTDDEQGGAGRPGPHERSQSGKAGMTRFGIASKAIEWLARGRSPQEPSADPRFPAEHTGDLAAQI